MEALYLKSAHKSHNLHFCLVFIHNIIISINEVATSDVHELSIKTAIMHQNNFYMVGNIHWLFLFYLL